MPLQRGCTHTVMRLLANVTDAELVRAAVFFSPNKWTVHFGINVNQFNGQFASPLSEHLLAALMGAAKTSSPAVSQQTQFSTPTPTSTQAAVIMSPAATQQPSPRSLPTQQPTQQPTWDPLSRYERSAKNGNKQSPPAGGAPYIPIAEASSFTGRLNKNHIDDTQSCRGNYA